MLKTMLLTLTVLTAAMFGQVPEIPNVSPNPAVAATDINNLLVATSETPYVGTYNGMSAAEASVSLGYSKISVEQSELEFHRANNRFNQGFDFLKSLVLKARGSKTTLWDRLIVEEYFKVLGLEIQRSEMAMMVYKKMVEAPGNFELLAKSIKPEQAAAWKKTNEPTFDAWMRNFDGINAIKFSADHDPILREAASHMPEGRARQYHMSSYSSKSESRVVTCYPINGCIESR